MGKRRRNQGPSEDQFGDVGGGQDREEHFTGNGRGGGSAGGGSGGGGRKPDLIFQRQVPKFLQQHAHMLGGSISNEEDPTITNQGDDSDDALGTMKKSPHDQQRKKHHKKNNNNDDGGYDNIEGEALLRAIEENPSLVVQHPELADTINKSKAAVLKEQGNRAFIAKDYQHASDIFTQCIRLDPGNEVYYSNRAAALMKLTGRLNEALKDAQQAVTLATGWAKAWVRCGECHFLLGNYVEAEETYRRAMKLEPDNNSIQEGLARVMKAAKEEEESGKHVFKMKKRGEGGDGGEDGKVKNGDQRGGGIKGVKKKALLSFGDDEDEEGVM